MLQPLDQQSEVVDRDRRLTPDWYSWLHQLLDTIPASGGSSGSDFSLVNVIDFGADPTGAADSTAAIQAAINAAEAFGTAIGARTGGIVYFPSGTYSVTAPLTFSQTLPTSVALIGSGYRSAVIVGNFAGYIISKTDNNIPSLQTVQDLTIINNRVNVDSGAILFQNTERGLITRCYIVGFIGIRTDSNAFDTHIEDCSLPGLGGAPLGSIGIMMGQTTVVNCRITGYDEAIRVTNIGGSIIGCACEVNRTAVMLGKFFDGTISGCHCSIVSLQTERCDTGIYVYAGGGLISGCQITGTEGVDTSGANASLSWLAGTVTVNTTAPFNTLPSPLVTGDWVFISDVTPSGYTGLYQVTVTGASQFTYALALNPGAETVPGTWHRTCQYGIRVKACNALLISGCNLQVITGYGDFDLFADGATSQDYTTIENSITNSGSPVRWVFPPTNNRAWIEIRRCDNPIMPMAFNDLPGQPGSVGAVQFPGAVEGMEYDINDCNTAVWGAVAAGGGANRVKVRYNGTNWTVMGI
jgi:hypothetical protein